MGVIDRRLERPRARLDGVTEAPINAVDPGLNRAVDAMEKVGLAHAQRGEEAGGDHARIKTTKLLDFVWLDRGVLGRWLRSQSTGLFARALIRFHKKHPKHFAQQIVEHAFLVAISINFAILLMVLLYQEAIHISDFSLELTNYMLKAIAKQKELFL